jgi:hypothetical protein
MHDNPTTMETDPSFGPAPAVADAASATIMRRAGELLHVLAKHLLDGSDPGRQTEALKGAVHILPSRLEAGHERER